MRVNRDAAQGRLKLSGPKKWPARGDRTSALARKTAPDAFSFAATCNASQATQMGRG